MRGRTHIALLGLACTVGLGLSNCVGVEGVEDECDSVDCGSNAWCDRGVCECAAHYDGDPDVGCDPIQTVLVQDACADGLETEFVIHAEDGYRWPGDSDVFVTAGFSVDTAVDVVCLEGELLCWGAQAGDLAWGVGLDGDDPCADDSCCFECFADTYDIGRLVCN